MAPYAALTERIIAAAMQVHTRLGPGLTEAPYQEALEMELSRARLRVAREVVVPLHYRGVRLKSHYRLDLVVEDLIVIEVKAVETVIPYHRAKLLSCLRASAKPVGLVLNFAAMSMARGIHRAVNSAAASSVDSASSANSAFP